jgi:tRNA A-37 threonylcarbamoyl transferase component Bud32
MKLGAYTIVRELSPQKSYLAADPASRKVVLKMLPPDCLLQGQLNPTVADRLRRIREVALTDVANLRGVERDGSSVFLVWDYVEGIPFDEYQGDRALLARELVRTMDHFHATGLVHGALHERNVVVDPSGRIKLIDVSPLLHLDPERDERAVRAMCERIADKSVALTNTPGEESSAPRRTLRRRTLCAALLLAMIGSAAAVVIHRLARDAQPQAITPPRLPK